MLFYRPFVMMGQPLNMSLQKIRLTLSANDTLYIPGNLHAVSSRPDGHNIHNTGVIILKDTLKNHTGALFCSSSNPYLDAENQDPRTYGKIIFSGHKEQILCGDTSVYFNTVLLDRSNLKLSISCRAFDSICFAGSNLNLNNNNLWLYDTRPEIYRYGGLLSGESPAGHITDSLSGAIRAYKRITPGADAAGLGVSFNRDLGILFIQRNHNSDTSITNGSIKKTFRITPSIFGHMADYGAVSLKYLHTDLYRQNEQDLVVWQRQTNGRLYNLKGTADTTANIIVSDPFTVKPYYYTLAEDKCRILPAISIPDTHFVCEGVQVDIPFTAYPDYSYSVTPPASVSHYSPGMAAITMSSDSYALNDTFPLILRVTSPKGCINADTVIVITRRKTPVRCYAQDAAGIKKKFFCKNESVFFRDSAVQDGRYSWDFGDGNFSDDYSPVHQYNTSSPYPVEVLVSYTSPQGCVTDTGFLLTIHPLPLATFQIPYPCVSTNDTILIENYTSGSLFSCQWKINDDDSIFVSLDTIISGTSLFFSTGRIDPVENPSPDLRIHFTDPKNYNIRLTAVNQFACSDDTIITTYISPAVYPSFDTGALTNVCFGNHSILRANDPTFIHTSHYRWKTADTAVTISPEDAAYITFPTPGFHPVTLISISKWGCADSVSGTVFIKPMPDARFSTTPVCYGYSTPVHNLSVNTGSIRYEWYENNSILSVTYPGDTLIFFSLGNSSYLMLTAVNHYGCRASDEQPVIIYPVPEAMFTANNRCFQHQHLSPLFINESWDPDTSAYKWLFGNFPETTSIEKNPLFTYHQPGEYTVTLEMQSAHGCKSSQSNTITIYPKVTSSFYHTTACFGNPTIMQPTEGTPAALITGYQWYHADTNLGYTDASNPVFEHTFSHPGQYRIRLELITSDGCPEPIDQLITVLQLPYTGFYGINQCAGQSTQIIIDTMSYNTSTISWDMGDGTTTNTLVCADTICSYLFGAPGEYQVSLIATSDSGCIHTVKDTITIYSLPAVDLGDSTGTCADSLILAAGILNSTYQWTTGHTSEYITIVNTGPVGVSVTDNSNGCRGHDSVMVILHAQVIVNLNEDTAYCGQAVLDAQNPGFGYRWHDGSTNRTFRTDTDQFCSVTVTSPEGCIGTDTAIIRIHELPIIELGNDTSLCSGDSMRIGKDIPEHRFLWNNGSTNAVIEVGRYTDRPVTDHYTQTVTNKYLCRYYDDIDISVFPLPVFSIAGDSAFCAGDYAILYADINQCTYHWSNGQTSKLITITQSGEYTVTVTNRNRCSATGRINSIAHPLPTVSLGGDRHSCIGDTIFLDAGNFSSYLWSNSKTTAGIMIVSSGQYSVWVTNRHGCSTISDPAAIFFDALPSAPLDDWITHCGPATLHAMNPGSYYQWSTGSTAQTIAVLSTGNYLLTITSPQGCINTDSTHVNILPVFPVDLGTDKTICSDDRITLSAALTDSNSHILWSNGATCQSITPDASGKWWIRVQQTNGCVVTDTMNLSVIPVPRVDLGNDQYLCNNESIVLDAGNPSSSYSWNANNGFTSMQQSINAQLPGIYTVKVSRNGCTATDTIILTESDRPITAGFLVASKLNAGDTVHFIDMSFPDPIDYYWNFDDGSTSYQPSPLHVFYRPGIYLIEQNVSNGVCSNSTSKIIYVEGYKNISPFEQHQIDSTIENNKLVLLNSAVAYPNPSNGIITLRAEANKPCRMGIQLYSVNGILIDHKEYPDAQLITENYNLHTLPPGIYLFRINAAMSVKTIKIIRY